MCTYYWTYINDLYAKELSKIPDDAYMVLDYTNVSAERIMQISEFLGLKGMDENIIQDMLNQKINSLENRGHASGDFPKWENWDSRLREQFDNIASDKMYKLGYYKDETTKWRPKGYGQFWSDAKGADNSWFEWMYESRINSHRNLIEFVLGNKEITSIADFGCGTAVGYSKAFEELKYTGVDISRENIEWCLSNRNNGNHSYICQDIVMEPLKEKADLVFSSGTIDNSYDVKAYIDSMIKSTNKWIYFTLYRGYFPNRDSISYSYNEEQKVYYNDIPVGVLRRYLEQAGCKYIDIRPEESSNNDIIYETRVIAHI
jgi:SAM-dependent methyltransferase